MQLGIKSSDWSDQSNASLHHQPGEYEQMNCFLMLKWRSPDFVNLLMKQLRDVQRQTFFHFSSVRFLLDFLEKEIQNKLRDSNSFSWDI